MHLVLPSPSGGRTSLRTAGTRASCQDKPTARRSAPWRKYTAATAPRRPATPSLNSSKRGSRPLG